MKRPLTFNVRINDSKIGKSIFAVNMKPFPATITDADLESLKSLIHYLVIVWTICWKNLNKIAWYELHENLS